MDPVWHEAICAFKSPSRSARSADIGEKKTQDVLLELATGNQLDRRDTNPFLIDFTAYAHGSCIGAAYIGMVARVTLHRTLAFIRAGVSRARRFSEVLED